MSTKRIRVRGLLLPLMAFLAVGLLAPDASAAVQFFGFEGTVTAFEGVPAVPNDPPPPVPQATLDRVAALGVTIGTPVTGFMTIDNTTSPTGSTYVANDMEYNFGTAGTFTFKGHPASELTVISSCPTFICGTTTLVDAWFMGEPPGGTPTTQPTGFTGGLQHLLVYYTTDLTVVSPAPPFPATAPTYFPLPNDADSGAGFFYEMTDSVNGFTFRILGALTTLTDVAEPAPVAVPLLPPAGAIALMLGLGGTAVIAARRARRRHAST